MQGQYPGDRSGTFAQSDGILTGTPTWTVSSGSVPFTQRFNGGMPLQVFEGNAPDLTLHLDAGDSIALASLQDWLYWQFDFADLTHGYWMLRTEGTGTLEVSDAFDDNFWYPDENPGAPWTPWNPCALAGSDGVFSYFTANPALLDKDHLWDLGYTLLRLECTSGTVDVTFAALRINQAQGYFDAQLDEDGEYVTTNSITFPESEWEPVNFGTGTYETTVVGTDSYFTVDGSLYLSPLQHVSTDYSTDWRGSSDSLISAEDALDDANSDFHAFGGLMGPSAYVSLIDNPAHGSILGPIPEIWSAQIREQVSFQSAPSKSTLYDLTPEGYSDLFAWESTGFEWLDDNTELKGWVIYGIDPFYLTQNYVATQGDGDDVTYSAILSTAGGEDLNADWFDPGIGTAIISGTTTDTYGGSVDPGGIPDGPYLIPLEDFFIATTDRLIYLRLELARRFEDDQLDQFTTWNGYSAGGEGTSAYLTSRRISDDVNLGGGRVAARYRIPMWRYKMPIYDLGWNIFGGRLKERQPDGTWRVLGNHDDTGGRWKFMSPDLTVWKEYRTIDGAVTTHPVKLYTADGWVAVVDMTPD